MDDESFENFEQGTSSDSVKQQEHLNDFLLVSVWANSLRLSCIAHTMQFCVKDVLSDSKSIRKNDQMKFFNLKIVF